MKTIESIKNAIIYLTLDNEEIESEIFSLERRLKRNNIKLEKAKKELEKLESENV